MSDVSDRNRPSAAQPAEIVREYGPYPDATHVRGVTYDGAQIWFAAGEQLHALDPNTGERVRSLDVACDAGTAFDGKHFYQVTAGRIDRIDPETGRVLSSIQAPGQSDAAGLTWAEGTLWVAQHRSRKIIQIDPSTGAVLRTLDSDRFVTGVTFVDGELWHGTGEDGQAGELRQIDPRSGELRLRLEMPADTPLSGLESNGEDLLFCGGGRSGRVRAVRRPKRTG
jgi:glutamine cyclotransferase